MPQDNPIVLAATHSENKHTENHTEINGLI